MRLFTTAGTEANPLGNLVEILVKLGAADNVAQVRVVVTGRSW